MNEVDQWEAQGQRLVGVYPDSSSHKDNLDNLVVDQGVAAASAIRV